MTGSGSPGVPALRPVARIEVKVAAPVMLGELAGAERRLVEIIGGTLTGTGFGGTILPGGSDIQAVRPDGTLDLVARYAVDLGEQGKLLIENTGIRRAAHPDSADGPVYFRGVVRFCAPPGPLQWLNDSVFVSSGRREGGTVILDVLELL